MVLAMASLDVVAGTGVDQLPAVSTRSSAWVTFTDCRAAGHGLRHGQRQPPATRQRQPNARLMACSMTLGMHFPSIHLKQIAST